MTHLKNLCLMLSMLLSTCLAFGQDVTEQLMPMPEKVTLNEGKFVLDTTFRISVTGKPNERIYTNASRFFRRVTARTGIFIFEQGFVTPEDNDANAPVVISVKQPGKLQLHEQEGYQLNITPEQIKITATTDLGAIHALETLAQMLSSDSEGYYFPAATVTDNPRFAWRGLMLDAGRHFMPVDVVKRTLDGMSATKLNVLHWHLSEDQGFRVESKVYPKLQELGSDGRYYTQAQIKDVVDYAGQLGIRVVPEFDVPGHASAMIKAYPKLASDKNGEYDIERFFGVFDPTLDPTQDYTYTFLDSLFTEMAALFPDEYFHIGGDENSGNQWNQSEAIQAYMKKNNIKNNHELQTAFNKRVLPILEKNGKKMMGWDEILQPGVPKNIVIQSWRGKESLYQSAKDGYQGILSNGYYIDLIEPTDKHYLNDPVPADVELTEAQEKRILGGEATMWSEHVTPETVDSRIWPRTAAIAERFWSPRSVDDVADMYQRLEKISLYLEGIGMNHLKNKDMLMRRLVNGYDTKALETLVNVLEPLKGYERNKEGLLYSTFSPYTKVADIATPDQKVARDFRNEVDTFLNASTEQLAESIRSNLTMWEENHHELLPVIRQAPVLKEIEEVSYYLSELATVGLEAMDIIEYQGATPKGWTEKAGQVVEEAAKQQGGRTEIMIVTAVKKLVEKASSQMQAAK